MFSSEVTVQIVGITVIPQIGMCCKAADTHFYGGHTVNTKNLLINPYIISYEHNLRSQISLFWSVYICHNLFWFFFVRMDKVDKVK